MYIKRLQNRQVHRESKTALLLVLAQRLGRESVKVGVQGIRGAAAFDQLHGTGNMAVWAADNHTSLLGVKAKLLVCGELGIRDSHVGDVVRIDVVVVIAENLGHSLHVNLVLLRSVHQAEGEELGVRLVTLKE